MARSDAKQLQRVVELRLKSRIENVFVFDDTWKRRAFPFQHSDTPEIKKMYVEETFDNQKMFGKQIIDNFDDLNVVNILAIAPTQSGKTGSMLATIHEFTRNDSHTENDMRTPVENIFIFTSHSSKEWKTQTINRFPDCLQHNIFHRNNLKKFLKRVKGVRNALIIFDECHIANKYGQTLYKLYCNLGLFNIRSLYTRNIKLLHFTATPGAMAQQLHDRWGESSRSLEMKVPQNYISHKHYGEANQLFQAKQLLNDRDAILEILEHMDSKPAFHLIRTPRGQNHNSLISQFKDAFKDKSFTFLSEPMMSQDGTDFTEIIKLPPAQHTFLFIIDKIRCAKTIDIQNINVVYDRFVNRPDKNSVIQGLVGRCTGYHTHTSQIKLFTFYDIVYNQDHTLHHTRLDNKHNIFNPC